MDGFQREGNGKASLLGQPRRRAVYLGTSGRLRGQTERSICKFLGDISYPLCPLVYFYVAWISNNKGTTIVQAWPYALAILVGAIVLAYASLKWYDEPV